ncbi:MAG: protein kinase [Planctomycetia bacterium]|nr:protein kinase [Planctomycetia bacterium]
MPSNQFDEKAIFNVARKIESDEARAEYLQQISKGDAGLINRVTALLHGFQKQKSFLESPPPEIGAATLIVSSAGEGPDTVIGAYKLREQIGEGGMGIVYVAEQERPVRRRVAFKVIKPGMDTKVVIARFEAERQALAMMDHSNIARVLDAGTTEAGRPYFVMELVKGIPITDYCDQARLSTVARLQLFLDVCRAVQHAHQKGIIHRDLKPSNVLVTEQDGRAIVKVIDFGIAKALGQQLTEKTIFTGHAQLVGTPLYMSPEQAALSAVDVDTRSDVYSLGVMLYELLTGTTPFDKEILSKVGFDELRRIIREQEHLRPSTRLSTLQANALSTICDRRQVDPRRLNHEVRGELDWIVMKALEKDRARRYETASAFAADIERYLADEPVEACPPSAAYRFRKFARKNRGTLTTAAVVAAALLIGLSVSVWQAVEAVAARNLADDRLKNETKALGQANVERARAEENFSKSLQVVDRMLTRVGAERMSEYSRGDTTRIELLRDAIEFYDDFRTQRPDDPELAFTVGAALHRIGSFYSLWSQRRNSAAAYEKAIAVLEEHAAEPMDSVALAPWKQRLALLIDCYHRLTELGTSVKFLRAEQALRRADELCATMLRLLPHDREARGLAARTKFAVCKFHEGRKAESELLAALRQAITEQKAILAEPGAGATDRIQLVESLVFLGELLKDANAAEGIFKEAELILAPSPAVMPEGMERWLLGTVLLRRARLRNRPDQLAEQEALIRRADPDGMELTIRVRDIGFRVPDGTAGELDDRLETILSQTGRTDEALAIRRRQWQITKVIDRNHQFVSYGILFHYCRRYVDRLIALKRIDEALWVCRDGIEVLEAGPHLWSAGPTLPGTISAIHALMAGILEQAGRMTEAEQETSLANNVVERALQEWRQTLKSGPDNWTALAGMAQFHLNRSEFAEALPYLERAAKVSLGPVVEDLRQQGFCHFKLGHYEEALRLHNECLDWDPSNTAWIPPTDVVACPSEAFREGMLANAAKAIQLTIGSVDAYLARADLLIAMERFEDARHDFAAVEAAASLDPRLPTAHNRLGKILSQVKPEEAIAEYRKAIELKSDYAAPHVNLGEILNRQGKLDEAVTEYRKAIELRPDDAMAHNNLAWALISSGDPKRHDIPLALQHAQRAVALNSFDAASQNTLGVACYRAELWTEALEHLESSLKLNKDAFGHNGFFLAMVHWQLGSKEQARQWYDQSVEWMAKNDPADKELIQFRAEASQLLGIAVETTEQLPPGGRLANELAVLARLTRYAEDVQQLAADK